MEKNKSNVIEEQIAGLMRQVKERENENSQLILGFERQLDDISADIIQIMDAFIKAEERIKDRCLDQDESAQKAIKQLLVAKKKTEAILDKYQIKRIAFEGGMADYNLCTIIDTEPDSTKEDGYVISIEKEGYLRDGRLIRRADVRIVKN